MSQKQSQDFNAFVDAQARAIAPLARFNELAVKALERTVRHGYNVAGDVLELGIAQLNATANVRDPSALIARQNEIINKFFDAQNKRYREWLSIASDAQEGVAKWASTAVDEVQAAARKAA